LCGQRWLWSTPIRTAQTTTDSTHQPQTASVEHCLQRQSVHRPLAIACRGTIRGQLQLSAAFITVIPAGLGCWAVSSTPGHARHSCRSLARNEAPQLHQVATHRWRGPYSTQVSSCDITNSQSRLVATACVDRSQLALGQPCPGNGCLSVRSEQNRTEQNRTEQNRLTPPHPHKRTVHNSDDPQAVS